MMKFTMFLKKFKRHSIAEEEKEVATQCMVKPSVPRQDVLSTHIKYALIARRDVWLMIFDHVKEDWKEKEEAKELRAPAVAEAAAELTTAQANQERCENLPFQADEVLILHQPHHVEEGSEYFY